MTPTRSTIATVLIAVLLVGAIATPAAAQNDSGDSEDDGSILGPIEGVIDEALETASGAYDRATYWFSSIGGDSEDAATASDSADELDRFADDHEDALVAYANAHAPENVTKTNVDVVRLDLNAGGEETTVYAVADVEDSTVESIDVVENTSRAVDLTLTFDEYATRELPSDLEHLRTNYVEEEKSLENLRGYIVGKYWNGDFDSEDSHVQLEGGDA